MAGSYGNGQNYTSDGPINGNSAVIISERVETESRTEQAGDQGIIMM